MKVSRLLNALILVILLLATASMPVASAPATEGSQAEALDKIESLVLEELAASGQTDLFIWMQEKADLSPAYQLQTKEERGRFVYETLRETAERTQRDLRRVLDRMGVEYRPFYIANKILVLGGTQTLALEVAARTDVARMTANHQFQLDEPMIGPPSPQDILAVGSNISYVNADDVWDMGFDGAGIVLAGNDTGLDWDHEALIDHYRGWNGSTADHNYNWWDATNSYPNVPGDGHGHGTHTTGTMVGDDGGSNQIGMAPGAQTIHCKNMTDSGSGNDATFTECFEWDLAPWDLNGQNPNPSLAPDAITNSWGYWDGNDPEFREEIAALHAAGILVEVSAGNEGDNWGCQSLRSPGDYAEVLTTGSVDHSYPYPGEIALHSSRGPSDLDPGYFPDIMAPGQSVRSSLPGDTYAYWGGTSMAGPHTTGLVGLLWSACPNLRGQVEQTMQVIRDTAVPLTGKIGFNCGGDYVEGPNHDWGHGLIDALAAVQGCGDRPPAVSIVSPAEGSTVAGTVPVQIDATDTEDPTGSLTVEWNVDGAGWQPAAYDSGSGYYEASWDTSTVGDGSHTINARATDSASNEGSDSNSVTVGEPQDIMHVGDLDGDRTTNRNKWTAIVTIAVHDASHGPVANATVSGTWSNGTTGTSACTTDGSGQCVVSKDGILKKVPSVHLTVDNVTQTSLTYVETGNHDPDGDSNGTTIIVYLEPPTNQPPEASFTYGCTELACDFDASGSYDPDGSIVSYDWNFGDGNTGSGVTASHTYGYADTYTVVLTVTDNESATGTDTQYVPVGAEPGTMFVLDIAMSGKAAGPNRSATAVVTIYDTGGLPVEGATVYGMWSGDYDGPASGVTGVDGTVAINSGKVRQANAAFTFTVDDVVKGGYTYDPALNVETSDSITVP
jgi:hypothetical protein